MGTENRPAASHDGACLFCAEDAAGGGISRRGLFRGAVPMLAAVAVPAGGAVAQTRPRVALPDRACVLEPSWVLAWRNDAFELLRDARVVVEGSQITAVTTERILPGLKRVPLPGQLLIPGLISAHTHAAGGSATRGIIEGGRSYARPLSLMEELTDDELDDLTAYNVAELLRGGATTHVEMSFSLRQAESYVRVAKRFGVRGYPGGMIPGVGRLFPIWFRQDDKVLTDSVPGTLAEIAQNLAFGLRHNGANDGLIRPQMAPHATDTHTPETMAAVLAAAKQLGNGIHIHLSQSTRETDTVKRLWGLRPAEWLEQLGFYSEPVFASHMTGMDVSADPAIMARNHATYVHCPSAGGAMGSGAAQPYAEALAAGTNVALGIDTHSNDMIENVKLAVQYSRTRQQLTKTPGPVPVRWATIWTALENATVAAARGLRRDDLGRIAAGAQADLVSVDVSGFLTGSGAPPPEPLNNLLYANGQSVRMVMTAGRFQVHDGQFVAEDEARIKARGGAVVAKLWQRLAAEDWFKPTPR